jgi:hypothetical protein
MLRVLHPDFATKTVRYDAIPGTRDVQLAPAATIVGRVIFADSGKPAPNIDVHLANTVDPKQQKWSSPPDWFDEQGEARDFYQQTRTDADGHYQFSNLPAKAYDLWTQSDDWLDLGISELDAVAGKLTTAPDMSLVKGDSIRIRLIDVNDKQPVHADSNAPARFGIVPEHKLSRRQGYEPSATTDGNGIYTIHVLPGKGRVWSVFAPDGQTFWAAAPRQLGEGEQFEIADGQKIDLDVEVQPIRQAGGETNMPPPQKPKAGPPIKRVPPAHEKAPATGEQGSQAIDIPIIVAKHVLLHDGKIIEWADVERLIAALPDPKLARPHFLFTSGAIGEREEEIRPKAFELQSRFGFHGHSWGSLLPRASDRYDAIQTPADLQLDKKWRIDGNVQTFIGGIPVVGAEVVVCPPVEESNPYKTLDIYLRDEWLRTPQDEIVTTSDEHGQFVAYPRLDTRYYLVALHHDGFAIARSDEFNLSKQIALRPWARITGRLKPDLQFKQSADVTVRMPAMDGWPEIVLHQYAEDIGQPTSDGSFDFAFVPPLIKGYLSRSVKHDDGGTAIPYKDFQLDPGAALTVDIEPPTDLEIKRIEETHALFERSRPAAQK